MGVVYFKGECILLFCIVFDYNKYGFFVIWVYLKFILVYVKDVYFIIDIVYFVSDGLIIQYRCKVNFYFLLLYFFDFGFKIGNWIFFEVGYGKGLVDGIGGVVKWLVDVVVVYGGSIIDVKIMMFVLENIGIKIKFFFNIEVDVELIQKYFLLNLDMVLQMMKFYQVS